MKTLPLRKLVVPTASGSDPDVIDIDDCREAVGEWPEIDTPCDISPSGQCEYNSVALDYARCKHCGKLTG